jgi:hypothetical protein
VISIPRQRRLIASLAVGAALVLTATGCSMVSPQATTITYSAAEGTNVYASGPIEVRNAQIVANEDGTEGNFVAALVNQTDEEHTLIVDLGDASSKPLEIDVPAHSTKSLGSDEHKPVRIPGFDALPGTDVSTMFQSGDAEGELVSVPVLDGTLNYLAPLAP